MTGPMQRRRLANVDFAVSTPQAAVEWICALATEDHDDRGVAIHLANAYSVALANGDTTLLETFRQGVVFPDGRPLSWFTSFKRPSLHQVRGPDLFEAVIREGQALGLRHFFLGGTDELLDTLIRRLTVRYPRMEACGRYSPPFAPIDEAELQLQFDRVSAAAPDIVWVGLGTPKQDFVTRAIAERCQVMAIAVGAAFDFSAGTKRVAPAWMVGLGLEWVFRLFSEPRRLWRRYTLGNMKFLWSLVRGNHVD